MKKKTRAFVQPSKPEAVDNEGVVHYLNRARDHVHGGFEQQLARSVLKKRLIQTV